MLATSLLILVVTTVGASTIDLIGSDFAPGEGNTYPNCAGPLTITTPVSQGAGNRVAVVKITGHMYNCIGNTMKVVLQLDNETTYYAVYHFETAVTEVDLPLSLQGGSFTDSLPLVINGDLVSSGQLVGPVKIKNISSVDAIIADSWV